MSEEIQIAKAELSRLCHGGKFQMCIPVNLKEDSDILIGNGLEAGDKAEARVSSLEAELGDGTQIIRSLEADLREMMTGMSKAADTFAEIALGAHALGHHTMARACELAAEGTRNYVSRSSETGEKS